MSRSKKKISICGNTKKESEKQDKRIYNRVLRRSNKINIKIGKDPKERNELYNTYSLDKDGKQFFDEDRFPELMRK